MSYQDVCAANPAKANCPFGCPCQGHYKVYPNQDCRCEAFAAEQATKERQAKARLQRKPLPEGVTIRDLLANPTEPLTMTEAEMKDLTAKYFDAYPGLKQWAAEKLGIELTPEQVSRASQFYGDEAAVRKTVEAVRGVGMRTSFDPPILFLDLGQPPALPEMHTPEEWARRRDEANAHLEGTDEEWEERKSARRALKGDLFQHLYGRNDERADAAAQGMREFDAETRRLFPNRVRRTQEEAWAKTQAALREDRASLAGTVFNPDVTVMQYEPKTTPDANVPPETAAEQAAFYELATESAFDPEAHQLRALERAKADRQEIRHRAWIEGYEACKRGDQMHSPYAREHQS
jgi:hypothetical protein